MKAGSVLLLVGLVIAGLSIPASVSAHSGVDIPGSRFRDYVAVNGTALVGFWLQSQKPVSGVVFSYADREERPATASMELVEGDERDGWWEATIEPNVVYEVVDGKKVRRISKDDMNLHISLPERVIEIDVSGHLATWTVEEYGVLLPVFPWSIPALGAALAGTVIGVVSLRNRLRGRWKSSVSRLAGAVIGVVSLRNLRRRERGNGEPR